MQLHALHHTPHHQLTRHPVIGPFKCQVSFMPHHPLDNSYLLAPPTRHNLCRSITGCTVCLCGTVSCDARCRSYLRLSFPSYNGVDMTRPCHTTNMTTRPRLMQWTCLSLFLSSLFFLCLFLYFRWLDSTYCQLLGNHVQQSCAAHHITLSTFTLYICHLKK
jgi:hypothetical protein